MYRVTDVVRHLLIINVLMYLASMLLGGYKQPDEILLAGNAQLQDWGRLQLAVFYPGSEYFRPYQLVTHMFMHSGLFHLFFNMFAVFMFGPPIEATWGPRKFLFFYLFTGFGALALHMAVQYFELSTGAVPAYTANIPTLGASGAVFGVLVGYGMLFPNSIIQLLFPPIPIRAKYFVLLYAGLELYLGLSGKQPGVAHFAHLGGALFGFLLILYWQKFGSRL